MEAERQTPPATAPNSLCAVSSSSSPAVSEPSQLRVSPWSGFHKKPLGVRRKQLAAAFPHLFLPPRHGLQPTPPRTAEFANPSCQVRQAGGGVKCQSGRHEPVAVAEEPGNAQLNDDDFPIRGLDIRIADIMVENCIGTVGLPVGLALNFVINGKARIIPMAIEEPSVVAAVSGAAKTICGGVNDGQGFRAVAKERNLATAQVLLLDLDGSAIARALDKLKESSDEVIRRANALIPSMVARGGGVTDIEVRRVQRPLRREGSRLLAKRAAAPDEARVEWLVVHLHVDVCEAMGANCVTAVAEGIAPLLCSLTGARAGPRIVSNLSTERMTKASFRLPVPMLAYKSIPGPEIARRIIEAYEWAEFDPFRAATHNKGVMNGVEAVAVATGQDWRAISAAAHAWASLNDHRGDRGGGEGAGPSSSYGSLTRYWLEDEGEGTGQKAVNTQTGDGIVFCGELEIPLPIGTKGGVVGTNPTYGCNLGIMGYPNTKELSMIMACAGLAQNFAALRALVSEGIQRGHMSLHAHNIAAAAGCPPDAIGEVSDYLVHSGHINSSTAKEYLLHPENHHHPPFSIRDGDSSTPDATHGRGPARSGRPCYGGTP